MIHKIKYKENTHKYVTNGQVICRNPHTPSNRGSRIPSVFDYKQAFCQNVVSTKNCLSS